MGDLAKNWPVYILLAGFVWFIVYVYIHSWRQEKKDNKQNNSGSKIKGHK